MHTSSSSTSENATPVAKPAVGLSAVELAAQRGVGPLSELGSQVWHGHARPCVSCGELVPRDAAACDQCGQDLSAEMIARMRAHAGPWYVHEHVRPFPGVTLDRLIRQARRGILTATTIVRGPTTHHQWRFAAETPGICKHVGTCWNCQAEASASDTYCPSCGIHLDRAPDADSLEASPAPTQRESELTRLSSALQRSTTAHSSAAVRPRRRGVPATVFIAVVVILFVVALVAFVQYRNQLEPAAGPGAKETSPLNVDLGYRGTPSAAVPAPVKPAGAAANPDGDATVPQTGKPAPGAAAAQPDGTAPVSGDSLLDSLPANAKGATGDPDDD